MNNEDLVEIFNLPTDTYYDVIKFVNKEIGFSVKREYKSDLIKYTPRTTTSSTEPDEVCMIRVGLDSKNEKGGKIPLIGDVNIFSNSEEWFFKEDSNSKEYKPISFSFSDEGYQIDITTKKILNTRGVEVSGVELLNSIYKKHILPSLDTPEASKFRKLNKRHEEKVKKSIEFVHNMNEWLNKRDNILNQESSGEKCSSAITKNLRNLDNDYLDKIKKEMPFYIKLLVAILFFLGKSIVPDSKDEKSLLSNRSLRGFMGNEKIIVSTSESFDELEIFNYKAPKSAILSFCILIISLYVLYFFLGFEHYHSCLNKLSCCTSCCPYIGYRISSMINIFINNTFLSAAGTLLLIDFWCKQIFKIPLHFLKKYFENLWETYYNPSGK